MISIFFEFFGANGNEVVHIQSLAVHIRRPEKNFRPLVSGHHGRLGLRESSYLSFNFSTIYLMLPGQIHIFLNVPIFVWRHRNVVLFCGILRFHSVWKLWRIQSWNLAIHFSIFIWLLGVGFYRLFDISNVDGVLSISHIDWVLHWRLFLKEFSIGHRSVRRSPPIKQILMLLREVSRKLR